jgi:hypothetical protein
MDKPLKPKKKILSTQSKTYYFNSASNEVFLHYFFSWCKRTLPKGAKKAKLCLIQDFSYDDYFSYLELSWEERKNNTRYNKELKKYDKQIKKWKELNKKCQ